MNRDRIFRYARKWLEVNNPDALNNHGACLHWTTAGIMAFHVLTRHIAIVQAGTCYWPRLPIYQIESDADKDPNHQYGFKWNGEYTPEDIHQMMLGNLPEMHIWIALPELKEIVDFSVHGFPDHCKQYLGLDWPGPKPPKYFWAAAGEIHHYVNYEPNQLATIIAHDLVNQILLKDS